MIFIRALSWEMKKNVFRDVAVRWRTLWRSTHHDVSSSAVMLMIMQTTCTTVFDSDAICDEWYKQLRTRVYNTRITKYLLSQEIPTHFQPTIRIDLI